MGEEKELFFTDIRDESTGQNVQNGTKIRFSREPVNAAHIVNRWFMLGIEQCVWGGAKKWPERSTRTCH